MEVPFDLGPWHGGHREEGRRPVRGFIWEVSEGEGAGEMGEAGRRQMGPELHRERKEWCPVKEGLAPRPPAAQTGQQRS